MKIRFDDKRADGGFWGRWGGGWDFKLGILIGKHEVYLEFLIFGISISWGVKNDK